MLSSEILNSAADLLEHGGWLQHYLARDHEGKTVQPEDTTACSFCILGAIWHFSWDETISRRNPNTQSAKDAVSRVLGVGKDNNGLIANYNDEPQRTKEEVVETLREAARQEVAAGR